MSAERVLAYDVWDAGINVGGGPSAEFLPPTDKGRFMVSKTPSDASSRSQHHPRLEVTEDNWMAKRRTGKHRGALNSYEKAWLEGDRKVGFLYSLNHGFMRQEL